MDRAKLKNIFLNWLNSERAVNMIELTLAVTLSSLIFISVMLIDVTSRRMYKASSVQTQLTGEIAFAMEHMQNNLRRANRIKKTVGNDEYIECWVDTTDPADVADDLYIEYWLLF